MRKPDRQAEIWIERHRLEGHQPYAAPTPENPDRWECKCDPDAAWVAVCRTLTPRALSEPRKPNRTMSSSHPGSGLSAVRFSVDDLLGDRRQAGLIASRYVDIDNPPALVPRDA